MKHIIRSLLLYLLIFGLLTFNLPLVSDPIMSAYLLYIILILVVFYSGEKLLWGESLVPGLLWGGALMGTIISLELITGWIKVEGFDFNIKLVVSLLIYQILVSVGEEISFRGYILKNLIRGTSVKTGIIITSFLFSFIHLPSILYGSMDYSRDALALIVVGMLSVLFSLIYLNYGLLSAISFHFAWNFLQYNVFNLNDSYQGIIKISYTGQNLLLTGDNFGPEAGILGFIIIFLALIIFIKKFAKSLN